MVIYNFKKLSHRLEHFYCNLVIGCLLLIRHYWLFTIWIKKKFSWFWVFKSRTESGHWQFYSIKDLQKIFGFFNTGKESGHRQPTRLRYFLLPKVGQWRVQHCAGSSTSKENDKQSKLERLHQIISILQLERSFFQTLLQRQAAVWGQYFTEFWYKKLLTTFILNSFNVTKFRKLHQMEIKYT